MRIVLKATTALLDEIRRDLRRPHPFAAERVGFVTARCTRSNQALISIASRYMPVPDNGYVPDPGVGAMMNQATILTAMQAAYTGNVSIIHVHMHDHGGRPSLSTTDRRESAKFMLSFVNVRPEYPHFAVVLSEDSLTGLCWLPGRKTPVAIDRFDIVGPHLQKIQS